MRMMDRGDGILEERRTTEGDGPASERIHHASGPRDALSARGHGWLIGRAASRSRCSPRITRTSKAAGIPSARFERSMDAHAISEADRQRFYVDNYVDLLGPVLRRRGLR